ncbi:reverse transcriptase domain-containing protein [Tanacetum coccineum]
MGSSTHWQDLTSPNAFHWLIPSREDTLDDEKAQERWDFTLLTLTKKEQGVSITDYHAGNPCEISSDLTDENDLSMIGRLYGYDQEEPYGREASYGRASKDLYWLIIDKPELVDCSLELNIAFVLLRFKFDQFGHLQYWFHHLVNCISSARIWLEKEPPRSILTWDYLVSKFINQLFPPSKTTNLLNEITRFQQRFDESFYEAWDRFNDLLRACPHHEFSELHQLDTFYNALNANDQDSLNSVAGGNFLDKMPRECLRIIESKSKVRNSRNKAVVAKVSSNSSTPGISPDVAALTTEVSELKNLF